MAPMRAAAAVLLGALGACAPQGDRPSGFGPVVRVCEGAACRDVETAALRGNMPEPDRRGERQSDPDVWRGEDPAGLQAAAESGDARAAHLLGQVEEYGLGGARAALRRRRAGTAWRRRPGTLGAVPPRAAPRARQGVPRRAAGRRADGRPRRARACAAAATTSARPT
jgi:hypothetical protein